MDTENTKIFIIDDEESVRRSFSLLLSSQGYRAESFSGIDELLNLGSHPGTGCILLDIHFEGQSGLDLQDEIKHRFPHMPIIYITGYGSVPHSVKAIKNGAINFLQKPVDDHQLFEAVEEAIRVSNSVISRNNIVEQSRSLYGSLTPREKEVFGLIISGILNKQIASKLNIAEQTVKLHRGKITEKLGLKSVAAMVRLAEYLDIR